MNNDEVKNVENKQSNSLMRKTKAQLIEIILRKDSVEKALREDIKGTENSLKEIEDKYNYKKEVFNDLKYNYEKMCDDKITVECLLNTKLKVKTNIIFIISCIAFISILCNIFLYLF